MATDWRVLTDKVIDKKIDKVLYDNMQLKTYAEVNGINMFFLDLKKWYWLKNYILTEICNSYIVYLMNKLHTRIKWDQFNCLLHLKIKYK